MSKREKMYYYTSTDTMQKILTGGNIFATHLDYMNDALECVNGLEVIRKILSDEGKVQSYKNEYLDENDDIKFSDIQEILTKKNQMEYLEESTRYSISFCKENDLLSQWTTYAKESGVSIEMEFDLDKNKKYEFLFWDNDEKTKERVISTEMRPEPVVYYSNGTNQEQIALEKEILTRLFEEYKRQDTLDIRAKEYIPWRWQYVSNFIKVYSFYQEREYRLAFTTHTVPMLHKVRIGYRTDKHVIKPYIDVECKNGWPITEIMVGPGSNQDLVFKSIAFFLDHADIRSQMVNDAENLEKQLKVFLGRSGIFEEDSFNVKEELKVDNEIVYKVAALKRMLKKLDSIYQEKSEIEKISEKEVREEKQQEIKKKEIKGKKFLWIYTKELAKDIIQKAKEAELGIDNDFANNYFSVSGIILRKSAIPYIY